MTISQGLTHVNGDFVASPDKFVVIVAAVQLGECRKTSRAHPVLEVFVNVEVGWWLILRVAIGEPHCPIGRGDDLREIISKLLGVFLGFAWPSDALLREVIGRGSSRWRVQESEIAERVY